MAEGRSERSGGGVALSWVWMALPAALLLGALGVTPLRSWDFWWHAAMGRLIDARGAVPAENLFLYTMAVDHPSVVQPWLAQLWLYWLEDGAGLEGVLLVRNLLGGLGWALLTGWCVKRAGVRQAGAVLALCTMPIGFLYIGARTHLFAWPLLMAVLWVCYACRDGRVRAGWLLAIPVMVGLWANLHGSFVVGLLVLLAFAADAVWRAHRGGERVGRAWWGGVLVLSAAATQATPLGWGVWGYMVDVATHPVIQETRTEWMPVAWDRPEVIGPLFWGLVAVGVAVMARERGRVQAVDVLLFGGFSVMAAMQARALLWFAVVYPVAMAPAVGGLVARWRGEREEPRPSRAQSAVHAVVVLMMAGCALGVQPWRGDHALAALLRGDVRQETPMRGLVPADTPVEAIWLLRGAGGAGPRLFHDHRSPGFLLYHLQEGDPRPMVFVDNRVELASPALWERFEEVSQGRGWREDFDGYDLGGAVLSTRVQQGLIDELERADDWQRLYRGEGYAVFMPERAHPGRQEQGR